MSELPPPPNPFLLPTLATVAYLATVAAFWGILSLALDREVIDYPDASPLLGPAMAAAAGIVTGCALLATRRARSPWPGSIAALVLSLAVMLGVAAVGYAPAAAVHFLFSPFILGVAAGSGITVLATWAIRLGGPR